MNILLTGATGLLGNNILRALLSAGHSVSCLLRTHAPPRSLSGLNATLVYGDLANSESLDYSAVPDFDVLIHCAAIIHLGWRRLEESRQVNVLATQWLADCCRVRGKRLIHISTVDTLGFAVDGIPITEERRGADNPQSAYVVSKREGDAVIDELIGRGLDAIVLHPGFMIGPFDWKPSSGLMMLEINRRPHMPFAPGGGCSAVDVRDVARGVVQSLEKGRTGEHYILAGHNVTYLELFQMIARTQGQRGPRWRLPDWLAITGGRIADGIAYVRGVEGIVNSASARMGQCLHYYDSGKAQRELAYTIGSLQMAIEDGWQWLTSEGYVR